MASAVEETTVLDFSSWLTSWLGLEEGSLAGCPNWLSEPVSLSCSTLLEFTFLWSHCWNLDSSIEKSLLKFLSFSSLVNGPGALLLFSISAHSENAEGFALAAEIPKHERNNKRTSEQCGSGTFLSALFASW